jgi:Spy/CpxP family protein refolding chaperone
MIQGGESERAIRPRTGEKNMSLNSELRDKLTGEMKEFSTSLNLSEGQKQKLQESLSNAYQKMQEYKQQNPGASKEDLVRKIAENRDSIRQRLVSFLTPEQLAKWDSEIAKAKDFLTQRSASA